MMNRNQPWYKYHSKVQGLVKKWVKHASTSPKNVKEENIYKYSCILPISPEDTLCSANLIKSDVTIALSQCRSLNCWKAGTPLHPLTVPGDQQSFYDSISVALWGILDSENIVINLLKTSLKQHGPLWERRLNLMIQDLKLSGGNVLPHHVFMLANIIHRPIIIVSDKNTQQKVKGLDVGSFDGIYLPLMSKPIHCSKTPIFVAYHNNCFYPLVIEAPVDKICLETKLQVLFPLVNNDLSVLPIKFLQDNEELKAGEFLQDYLIVKETDFCVGEELSSILFLQSELKPLPEDRNTIVDYVKTLKQQYHKGNTSQMKSSEGQSNSFDDKDQNKKIENSFKQQFQYNESRLSPGLSPLQPEPAGMHDDSYGNNSRKDFAISKNGYQENEVGKMPLSNTLEMGELLHMTPSAPDLSVPPMSMTEEKCVSCKTYRSSLKTHPYCHECYDRLNQNGLRPLTNGQSISGYLSTNPSSILESHLENMNCVPAPNPPNPMLNSHPTLNPMLNRHPPPNPMLNSHLALNPMLNSHPTLNPMLNSHPTPNPMLNSHPTPNPMLNSHLALNPMLNSHPTLNPMLNSHPTLNPMLNSHPPNPMLNSHPTPNPMPDNYPTPNSMLNCISTPSPILNSAPPTPNPMLISVCDQSEVLASYSSKTTTTSVVSPIEGGAQSKVVKSDSKKVQTGVGEMSLSYDLPISHENFVEVSFDPPTISKKPVQLKGRMTKCASPVCDEQVCFPDQLCQRCTNILKVHHLSNCDKSCCKSPTFQINLSVLPNSSEDKSSESESQNVTKTSSYGAESQNVTKTSSYGASTSSVLPSTLLEDGKAQGFNLYEHSEKHKEPSILQKPNSEKREVESSGIFQNFPRSVLVTSVTTVQDTDQMMEIRNETFDNNWSEVQKKLKKDAVKCKAPLCTNFGTKDKDDLCSECFNTKQLLLQVELANTENHEEWLIQPNEYGENMHLLERNVRKAASPCRTPLCDNFGNKLKDNYCNVCYSKLERNTFSHGYNLYGEDECDGLASLDQDGVDGSFLSGSVPSLTTLTDYDESVPTSI